MSALEIRPLQAGDEQDWRRLWKDYLAFYETELPEKIHALTWKRLLSGDKHEYAGFLAVKEGKAVGLAHYLFHRSCWLENNACYLQDLYADPEVRGSGIGRAPDRGGLCQSKGGRIERGLLDDAGIQPHRPHPL